MRSAIALATCIALTACGDAEIGDSVEPTTDGDADGADADGTTGDGSTSDSGATSGDGDGDGGDGDGSTACTGTATYTVTFTADWTATTHPAMYPSSPHFSPLIVVSHTDAFRFWQDGELATVGIKDMAELGDTTRAVAEVGAAGAEAAVEVGSGLNAGTGSIEVSIDVAAPHDRLSATSMLAPSPDWFVGFDSESLCDAGQWVDSVTLPAYVWDAGTDGGGSYQSSDAPLSPAESIALLDFEAFWDGSTRSEAGELTVVRQ
jgi:hypothetical protein